MEALKENFTQIETGTSVESYQKYLNAQRELLLSQIDQLRNVVISQCRLTGVNPLSQEMAAGALSIKIGKRPRDLLNPKAVKYMQAIFSVKDSITKKECRDISAQFGITVTQVKDFFASQRSRVRKLVRLSREKAIRSNANKELDDHGNQFSSVSIVPIDHVPLNSTSTSNEIPINPVPLNSIDPPTVEDAPSSTSHDDGLVGLNELDKQFVENIFSSLRKEETFSGQVKLMEWILDITNPSVKLWFLTKGGLMILATWLSHAVIEEQTSVLVIILQVFCHLPLHKALPEHMSAVLQSVNSLRFYRSSDVSNRARDLLSKWSKMLVRNQAMKKPNGMKMLTDSQSELILKQSIGEIMAVESWHSSIDDAIAPSHESSENIRKLESPQVKLLAASTDDSARKNILGVSATYNRERRKVQLVEQPGQRLSSRNSPATKAAPVSQSRPMSADDIQKAKLRAMYMQSKYRKTSRSSNVKNEVKADNLGKSETNKSSILPQVACQPKSVELKAPVTVIQGTPTRAEAPPALLLKINSEEPPSVICRRSQIPWCMPPEMKLNETWRVGGGEGSKEAEVQRKRNQREMETKYRSIEEIPTDPKKPWDIEMDYDDSLTPEIPTEQPPEFADDGGTPVAANIVPVSDAAPQVAVPSSSVGGDASGTEPDLELLAVLLKHPELVYALTSGRGSNLSSEDTVKLLDMVKANGAGLAGNVSTGIVGKVEEQKAEVSLPSPTPSTNPGTSGWRQEVVKNPFSTRNPVESRVHPFPQVSTTTNSATVAVLERSRIQATNITNLQKSPTLSSFSQQIPPRMHPSLLQTNPSDQQTSAITPSHQSFPINPPRMRLHTQSPEIPPVINNQHVTSMQTLSSRAGPPVQAQTISSPALSMSAQPQMLHPQVQQQPHMVNSPHFGSTYPNRTPIGNLSHISDSWRASQAPVYQQANQNTYNAPSSSSYGRGPVQQQQPQPQLRSGPPNGFESWSPSNSPTRAKEYMSRRNFPEPSMNNGWNHRPERSREWNSSGYREFQDPNKLAGRKWHDRRP